MSGLGRAAAGAVVVVCSAMGACNGGLLASSSSMIGAPCQTSADCRGLICMETGPNGPFTCDAPCSEPADCAPLGECFTCVDPLTFTEPDNVQGFCRDPDCCGDCAGF